MILNALYSILFIESLPYGVLVVVIETNNPDSGILKKHLLVRKMRQIIR